MDQTINSEYILNPFFQKVFSVNFGSSSHADDVQVFIFLTILVLIRYK